VESNEHKKEHLLKDLDSRTRTKNNEHFELELDLS
jgi:hypothetical protein